MPLTTPEGEHLRKLHSEITQIVNQRFLVTTLAITTFGVGTAWIIPKEQIKSSGSVPASAIIFSTLLCAVLFLLFLHAHSLLRMMRIFTSYLIVTGASPWEKDWKEFRDKWPTYFGYFGYTRTITVIFLFLEGVTASFPLMIAQAYGLALDYTPSFLLLFVTASVSILVTLVLGIKVSSDSEEKAIAMWKRLKA